MTESEGVVRGFVEGEGDDQVFVLAERESWNAWIESSESVTVEDWR